MLFRHAARVINSLLRSSKWDQVAQFFAAWENAEHAAIVFRHEVAMQILFRPTGRAEVIVIQYRVRNARPSDIGRQRTFPDTLRHPHALYVGIEQFIQITGVTTNLPNAIAAGQHGQYWFVKRPRHHFNTLGRDQGGNPAYIFRCFSTSQVIKGPEVCNEMRSASYPSKTSKKGR